MGYLTKVFTILVTKRVRLVSEETASEKCLLHVQPPNDKVTFNLRPESNIFLNCPKFPNIPEASFQVSAGGTLSVPIYRLSVSAQASPVSMLPSGLTFQNA